jgi:hypothetical protein|tara:strand:+ start:770 stop:1105 length:336 start_codon:yes stop_codon:yes gene_type:complete
MPDIRVVKAKTGDGDTYEGKYSFPASLAEAGSTLGEAVALSLLNGSLTVDVQSVMRNGIKAEKSPAEIQKNLDAYKPGLKKRGRTKAEKVRDEFDKLSGEEKKELLARLTK